MDEERMPPNDATLARKVETQLFADPDLPKGRININAEHGVVVLRGELDRPEEIDAVETAARKVSGVLDVKNLLHLTGTPART
jgi:osmotically-inducible protein OsmY